MAGIVLNNMYGITVNLVGSNFTFYIPNNINKNIYLHPLARGMFKGTNGNLYANDLRSYFKTDHITDMSYMFSSCRNYIGSYFCPPNCTNMAYAFYGVNNYYNGKVTGSPVIGGNVKNATYCYFYSESSSASVNFTSMESCRNCFYIGPGIVPGCGQNTIDMSEWFQTARLSGSPVCGPNVKFFNWVYAYPYTSIGNGKTLVCGPNVITMSGAYSNFRGNGHIAQIGQNVIEAKWAFVNTNLASYAIPSNSLTICPKLYSTSNNIPNNVTGTIGNYALHIKGMFGDNSCKNIYGDIYVNCNDITFGNWLMMGSRYDIFSNSDSISFTTSTNLINRQIASAQRLNIWLPRDSAANNYYFNVSFNYNNHRNANTRVTWTLMDNGYYNTATNIYVYYNNPYAFNFNTYNAKSLDGAYYMCTDITGAPVCGPYCISLESAYYNCSNLTGSPACGDNVLFMYSAYYNCRNLTGSPVCGNNVLNMSGAYSNCINLTGSPVCGPNVITMSGTYANCSNLTGSPVCGPNVITMYRAYYNCSNLTGNAVIGNNVSNLNNAFVGCVNLNTNFYWNYILKPGYNVISNITDSTNCAFANLTNVNLFVKDKNLYNLITPAIFGYGISSWQVITNNSKSRGTCKVIYTG